MKKVKTVLKKITTGKYIISLKEIMNSSIISIIAGIFGIIFSLIGCLQTDLSLSRTKEMNNIIYNTEDVENYSTILSNYYQAIDIYSELLEQNENSNSNDKELQELENQINELTANISNMNVKIDKIESAIVYNNNHDVISSIITGICTIIAALIAGGVAIKVAKMKKTNKE